MQLGSLENDTRRIVLWAALATVGIDCTPEPGDPFVPRYETNRLRIGTSFDYGLCRGYLDAWEAHLDEIKQTLDVSREITWLYLYDEDEQVIEICDEDIGTRAAGCWDGTMAHATFNSTMHELVHAWAAIANPRPLPVLSEGIAGRMTGALPYLPAERRKDLTVDDLLTTKVGPAEYQESANFVAWLLETYSAEVFMDLYTRASRGMTEAQLSAVFLDVLGMSMDSVLQAWTNSAKEYYPGMGVAACGRGPVIPWRDDVAIVPLDGSCEDGPFIGFDSSELWRRVTIQVASSGMYLFDSATHRASLTRCLAAPADKVELPALKPNGVTSDWTTFYPLAPGCTADDWVDTPLELEAGTYEMWVERDPMVHFIGPAPDVTLRKL